MKFIKRSARPSPKLSLILLDWSVRESFHLLHYLGQQDVARDTFEVLVIEYYSRVSEAVRRFESEVDTWLLLEMPEDCYYHKHLMYNAGILLARGELCVICDSDAMVKPGFVRAILEAFEREPGIVLHLDQFRNNRRDFYPFNYPSFEEVVGEGCINNAGGRTTGVLDERDPLHSRNYGACMCARRADLIRIGGADEHVDFVGHICGPYDMTFRLVNSGRRELWHPDEFLYHTWHPGQAGVDNYLGPHDGRHMSTTALSALASRRVRPLLENPAIRRLREGAKAPPEALLDLLIRADGPRQWRRSVLESGAAEPHCDEHNLHIGYHRGYALYRDGAAFYAHLAIEENRGRGAQHYSRYAEAPSLAAVRARVDALAGARTAATLALARLLVLGWQVAFHALRRWRRRAGRPLAANAGAMRSPAGLAALLRFRLAQLSAERRALTASIADLVPNLHAAAERGIAPRLVVEDRRTEFILGLLRALGAIPPLRLERAESCGELERIVAQQAERAEPRRLILTRNLYCRCYPSIAGHYLGGGFTVL
ncbi:MAG TPA: glycosyltransferase family 2 protein [Burkholderiales bacterium]|nr:glycosyltransferase family 2 protein [Burkholderiales bacterium]